MNRLFLAGLLGLLAASSANADIPPPKGLKRVQLDQKITTEKDITDYSLFTVVGGEKVEAVKLDAKTPLVISGAGRGGRFAFAQLVAVPTDSAKKYGTEKEFFAAIASGKVEGLVKAKNGFGAFTTVKDTDTRKVVVEEYTFEKIDAKEGIVLKSAAKEKEPEKKSDPQESDEPGTDATAFAPRGGVWVAGLALTAALVMGGLWLSGRNRRRELGS